MLRDILIQKGLSNREAEVAELVSKGLSNKEVANQLFVTEKTVKFHLTNIYKKMNVKSRAQLIVWCLPHLGFVESEARVDAVAAQAAGASVFGIPSNNSAAQNPVTTILPGAGNQIRGDFGGGRNGNGGGDVGIGA